MNTLLATCRRQLKPSRWKAILGLYDQSDLAQPPAAVRNIDRIIMSPHYMKKTKDSDIALMHLEHKVQYTGQFFIFPKDQFIPIYSMMQNSAEHVRVVGSLLSTFWISWAKSVFKLMNIFWCDFIKT